MTRGGAELDSLDIVPIPYTQQFQDRARGKIISNSSAISIL